MKVCFLFLLALVVHTKAQDTYNCPDGWEYHEPDGNEECECYLFADNYQRVNHGDAEILCQSHGGWLAEIEDGPSDNYWLVDQLKQRHTKKKNMRRLKTKDSDLSEPHFEDQWWIGGRSYTKHNDHNPGQWVWEHLNSTIEWFDWAPGEPNDWHRQQCLTFLRYDYGDDFFYNWNDWDCNTVADYICQKPCATP